MLAGKALYQLSLIPSYVMVNLDRQLDRIWKEGTSVEELPTLDGLRLCLWDIFLVDDG